jgi:hypothetical protein
MVINGAILLMDIGEYFIMGYWWLLVAISGAIFRMVVVLVAICSYFNVSYCKLFFIGYYWLF